MALGLIRVRGDYHERLRTLLKNATQQGVCTQDSLSRAIGKTQTGVGKYLLGKGGALDLDEAAAALHHVGSSLPDFLGAMPPRTLTSTEQLVRALESRPELRQLVEALLPVPKSRLGAVLALVRGVVPIAIGPPGGRTPGSRSASTAATHTKSGRARRQ
jgi:hypothetical protein